MVLEIADILVHPGTQTQFEREIQRGVETVIAQSPGFLRYEVQHGVENPDRYVLLIEWERLENHTIDFRESAAFTKWRGIVGSFFARPPVVEHFLRTCGTR
jgi:heme-degrading monooxygenase HmoA